MRGDHFIGPRASLEAEYGAAVERLRRERGEPRTLRERWRFWLERRRLHRELVEIPRRAANW
jgi:hypothetical protein